MIGTETGECSRAQIVPVREAAGQNDDVNIGKSVVVVPHELRVRAEALEGALTIKLAVRSRKYDDADSCGHDSSLAPPSTDSPVTLHV